MFLLELGISTLVIAFTSSSSTLRPAALPFVALCVYTVVLTSSGYMRAHWASLLSGTSIGFFLHYIDLGLLDRWSYQDRGPSSLCIRDRDEISHGSAKPFTGSIVDRLKFGLTSTFSFRHIDTPWEVKNTPRFSEVPGYLPSYRHFLLQSMLTTLICFFVIDVSSVQPPPQNNGELFSWDVVPIFTRLRNVTAQQLKLRFVSSLIYWVNMFCIMQGVTSIVSVLSVGLGFSEVKYWRPLFGSPRTAYSLRRF